MIFRSTAKAAGSEEQNNSSPKVFQIAIDLSGAIFYKNEFILSVISKLKQKSGRL